MITSQLILLVLENDDVLGDVVDAWTAAGASGVTLVESTGISRVRANYRDDVPLFPSLRDLLRSDQILHTILFCVTREPGTAEALLHATESIVGDLDQPGRGMFCVLPIAQIKGFG